MSSHFVKAARETCHLRRGLTCRDRIPITPIVRPENPFEHNRRLAIPTCLGSTTKRPIETIELGLDWRQGNSHWSIEKYLRDLTEKLKQAHNLTRENSEKAQAEYESRYNLRSREKRLAVGDKVLILIPSSSHKLLKKKWMGPASIVEPPRPHTARVKMEDGSERELHFKK
ncbi:retrovirus-related Pol polyprotein from transposon opus [Trichonephila inaurata madagascariensis]|uniref:Retrovirus-related Pol polyprotein from transposon opus n=1 Tax=Trichonephila inaurata madagascariensis TaxID=2747483 RepID=A0A8X6YQL1_9ARAC|nr:retrovirus-related Pol polyprotein from transposon opus [Trichonephila inaurata madagascariensis]